jgi:glycosyltransferase involved in cell wall biosynthesis
MTPPTPRPPAGRAPSILISGGLAPGGVQTHVALLCRLLRASGAAVTVAAPADAWPADETRGLRDRGVRVLTTPFGFGPWSRLGKLQAVCTWPLLLRRRFDTLYCHGRGEFHLWMRRFLRPGGAAVYHEIVDAGDDVRRVSRVLRSVEAVVANSGPVADGLRALHPGVPVRVIPFLTAEGPVPPPPPRPAVGGRELRVAYLGRLVAHKQPDWLVEQWESIVRHGAIAPARLDVYGADPDGSLLERLRGWVRSRKLDQTVRLHGGYAAAQLPAILAATDLVVLPSLWEGLPLVLVEAMQRGVPFVATAAGGTSDLANPDVEVVPVENGRVVEAMGRMAARLRAGAVDARRLHGWAEARYGFAVVARQWRGALLDPHRFFDFPAAAPAAAGPPAR